MDIRHTVEVVGLAVDAVGVAVIVIAIGVAGVAFVRGLNRGLPFEAAYRGLRQSIGRGILLGLELLVGATSSAPWPSRRPSPASGCWPASSRSARS